MAEKILIKDYYNCINSSVWQKKDCLHLLQSQRKKFPVAGHTTKKGNTSLNPRVILTPIDHNQGQNTLNPPNQPVNLPEQLQNNPNQLPPQLIPANLPNQQNLPNQ